MALSTSHFEALGYEVKSVEVDCLGWDLEASRKGEVLYLEVKGHIGDVVKFELTPNEYAKLKSHASKYRVCVVLSALDQPILSIFHPKKVEDFWTLAEDAGLVVKLQELVAARAVETL